MKKRVAVLLALAFLLLLAGVYFLAPVRPALARATANRHIQGSSESKIICKADLREVQGH